MMGKGVGFGKITFAIDGEGRDVVEISSHEKNGLGGIYLLGATEVVVSTGRCEPVTKTGNSIVHSSVVALSYHASVCALE